MKISFYCISTVRLRWEVMSLVGLRVESVTLTPKCYDPKSLPHF